MFTALAGALLIGVSLGLLGSGGSILTVPTLVYLVGQDEKVAIAGSLGIVGAVSLAGCLPYASRHQIDWRRVLLFGVPGMVGTSGGAWLSRLVSGGFQLGLFACVMLVAAWFMLRPAPAPDASRPRLEQPRWKIGVDGLAVGLLTGLVGVGGGFLIIPALVLLGGLAMQTAVGTSLVIIAMKSFAGFLSYLGVLSAAGRHLDWKIIGIFVVVGALGTILGGRLAGRIPAPALQRAFGGLLVVTAAAILITRIG